MTQSHLESIQNFARAGGKLALDHYQRLDELEISEKGWNDLVSNADRGVEVLLREAIAHLPDGALATVELQV